MLILYTTLAFSQSDPSATLTWDKHGAQLSWIAPSNEHFNLDASAEVRVVLPHGEHRLLGSGAILIEPWALGDLRGQQLRLTASLPLCTDSGSQCRIADLALGAEAGSARRGQVVLRPLSAPLPSDPWEIATPVLALAEGYPTADWVPLAAAAVLHQGGLDEDAESVLIDALTRACGANFERLRAQAQVILPTAFNLKDGPIPVCP